MKKDYREMAEDLMLTPLNDLIEEKEDVKEFFGIGEALLINALLLGLAGGTVYGFKKLTKLNKALRHNQKLKKLLMKLKDDKDFVNMAKKLDNEKSEMKKQEIARKIRDYLDDKLGYSTAKDVEKLVQVLSV